MATINLGRVKPVFRGAYAGGTAYVVDDIVTSGNETFICIQASTGNATSNASYWTKLAAKGTDGTDVSTTLTTQGDILYRDGSGLQRLGAGTNGQFLKTLGTGANPAWADLSAGIKQIKLSPAGTTQYTVGNTNYTDVGANYQVTITPTSASNRILIYTQFADQGSSAGRTFYTFSKSGDSSGNGDIITQGGFANVENINTAGNGFTSGMWIDNSIASTNALTYKLQMATNGNNSHVNVSSSYSFMMCMELDGGLF